MRSTFLVLGVVVLFAAAILTGFLARPGPRLHRTHPA